MAVKLGAVRNSICLLLLLCVYSTHALYSSSSPVAVLDAAAFNKNVKNGQGITLVEFFAPWCGHCKAFAPEYEKAARALKGVVKVVAVEDQAAMASEGVQGFPTVKLYVGKGETPISYEQARTADALVDFVTKQVTRIVKQRLSPSKGKGQKSKGSSSKPSASDVIEVNDDNFDELVLADEKSIWFLEIYAPWCGHCKALAPKWESLATQLKGKVKVGKIDGTVSTTIMKSFAVKGFPTLKLLPRGKKAVNKAVSYDGPRDTEDMLSFVMEYAGTDAKSEQLLSNPQFLQECQKSVCILAILPDLFDSMAEGRNKYLKEFDSVAKSSGNTPVKFFWTEGGKNLDFEEALHLQFGYPAVVAVHLEKKKFAVHKGHFSLDAMKSFLVSLMAGRATLSPIPERLPEIVTTGPWDGKDPVPLEEPEDEYGEDEPASVKPGGDEL